MKFKFSHLLALSAMLIAGCAAYYSVFGLSQLFAGASLAVIIMASCLEFSKVVAVSFLQRYWLRVSKGLRTYLTIGVCILVLITSAGIYGFLSNAYQKTASKSEVFEGQVGILTNKKAVYQKGVDDNQKIIDTKNKRIDQLTTLRTNQETRLDQAANSKDKSRARADIESANKEIQKLTNDIDALNTKNTVLSDSASVYSTKEIQTKTGSNAAAELGPLKYLAELTGKPMGTVVNWFILLLIFVFDPLAVALVIATNKVMQLEGVKKKEEPQPLNDDDKEEYDVEEVVDPVQGDYMDAEIIDEDDEMEGVGSTYNNFDRWNTDEDWTGNTETLVNEGINEGINDELKAQYEEYIEKLDRISDEIESDATHVPATGKIQREDIREVKESRGFSVPIPPNKSNSINRI